MKLIEKIFFPLSLSVIFFTITIFKFETICMEESQKGYGHFLVWLIKGYSSLSYQIDLVNFSFDFAIIFIIAFFCCFYYRKYTINNFFKILLYFCSSLILLVVIFSFFIFEIYFREIECKIIFNSISFGW